jgi:hypothetical protein
MQLQFEVIPFLLITSCKNLFQSEWNIPRLDQYFASLLVRQMIIYSFRQTESSVRDTKAARFEANSQLNNVLSLRKRGILTAKR